MTSGLSASASRRLDDYEAAAWLARGDRLIPLRLRFDPADVLAAESPKEAEIAARPDPAAAATIRQAERAMAAVGNVPEVRAPSPETLASVARVAAAAAAVERSFGGSSVLARLGGHSPPRPDHPSLKGLFATAAHFDPYEVDARDLPPASEIERLRRLAPSEAEIARALRGRPSASEIDNLMRAARAARMDEEG